MWAADKGDGPIVRCLLEHGESGADRDLLSSSGQKAEEIALIAGHKDVAALLKLGLQQADYVPTPSSDDDTSISELDIVLMGLALDPLIPIFRKHKMTYDSFLMMDEKDLDQMGIKEVSSFFIHVCVCVPQ